MHKILVLYPPPKDPEHFRGYYASTHIPLAAKMPGLERIRFSTDVQGLGADSPYFCVAELDFDSVEAMNAALQSPEGKATSDDVPNYASSGAIILHYETTEG